MPSSFLPPVSFTLGQQPAPDGETIASATTKVLVAAAGAIVAALVLRAVLPERR